MIFQGKIDATLGSADTIARLELRGQKVSVLGDLADWGVVTTGGDFAAMREFLKTHRPLVKAFLMALAEATWLGRTDKEIAFKATRKYLRIDQPPILESVHKNYLLGTIPPKLYPLEAGVETAIEEVAMTQPAVKGKKPADFLDVSILKEIENEDFFARLQR